MNAAGINETFGYMLTGHAPVTSRNIYVTADNEEVVTQMKNLIEKAGKEKPDIIYFPGKQKKREAKAN
jgi:hypothetical protein